MAIWRSRRGGHNESDFGSASSHARGLGVVYLMILFCAQLQTGVTRDEGYYFKAAHEYSGWFKVLSREPARAFTQTEIDRHWSYNHEHPVIMKVLFAGSNALFHDALRLDV